MVGRAEPSAGLSGGGLVRLDGPFAPFWGCRFVSVSGHSFIWLNWHQDPLRKKGLTTALAKYLSLPPPMISFPGFKTKRLILKPLSLDDIPSYERHFVDYEVIRHLSAVVPWPYPRNGVREFFQNVLLPPQGSAPVELGIMFEREANRTHRLLRALATRHP